LENEADLNIIVDNSIKDGTYDVYISPSQGNLVQNNTIIRMNKGNTSWGIYLGVGAVLDTTLSDNAIIDCDGGIRAATTADHIITGLSAIGNSVSGSLGEGMYLVYVNDSQVLNNSFSDGGATAYWS